MGLVSSAIRGCIVAPPGKKLCVADLSNIEGRILAWLAGESWKLQAFKDYDNGTGHDLYALAYAKSFGVTPEAVMDNKENGDGSMRQIGKVQELALGYQGGVGAFLTFAAAYGIDLEAMALTAFDQIPADTADESRDFMEWLYGQEPKTNPQYWIDKHGHSKDETQRHAEAHRSQARYDLSEQAFIVCESFKRLWRDAHPATSSWWKQLEDAARAAVQNPGQAFKSRRVTAIRTGNWLRLMLPSGRSLCYPSPKVDDKGTISYMGVNQYTRKWERITIYGGKLCIAENTKVLTLRGWVNIQHVTNTDKVWDGLDWVSTGGAVCNGVKDVIEAFGAWMTPDHEVLTVEGWKRASQSKGYNRAYCRLPDGSALSRIEWAKLSLGNNLRMRSGKNNDRFGTYQTEKERHNRIMRLQVPRYATREAKNTRHEPTPGVRGVAQHVRSLPATYTPSVEKLRRERHNRVPALAREVRKLLGRYGADLRAKIDARSYRQRPRVFTRQLPLGFVQSAGKQHSAHNKNSNSTRSYVSSTDSRKVWNWKINFVLSAFRRGDVRAVNREAGFRTQVYDLIDCGPLHRFTVATPSGPLIVHNCENVTQAAARDVLAANMPAIEAAGYQIVLTVHDEIISEAPDTDAFNADHLAALMAANPPWAEGLPLAAAGFEAYRYRKG